MANTVENLVARWTDQW